MTEVADGLPDSGYAVVRCEDMAVVAIFADFPDCERAIMYRQGINIAFMPLRPDEIIGTPTLFTRMMEKAGYRIT